VHSSRRGRNRIGRRPVVATLAGCAALLGSWLVPAPIGAQGGDGPEPSTSTTTSEPATSTTTTTATTAPTTSAGAAESGPSIAAALGGHVLSDATPLTGYTVTLFASNDGAAPSVLGTAVTDGTGAFALDPVAPVPPNSVVYVVAESPVDGLLPAGARTLTSVLDIGGLPDTVVVNELTTVAMAYALAQFIGTGIDVVGPSPGVQNAAGMAHNLADPVTGAISPVVTTKPNDDTSTHRTFRSLANMVAACVAAEADCAALFAAATSPEGVVPTNTFRAMYHVARDPWHSVDALFALSLLGPTPYQPARVAPPAAWTLALRFVGDGMSLDGPGNFAIDHRGFIWVNNNFEYDPTLLDPVCGSDELFQFTPTGQFVPGSPFTGGGLSGAGYGIDIDPFGDIWVGNFGFASPAPGCPEDRQPLHNSLSKFRPDGSAISPSSGFTAGELTFPQATVSDEDGNIWVANCGDGSVTIYPNGDPLRAKNISGLGLEEAFGVAHNRDGVAFVTGIGSNNVAMLGPDGTPLPGSPISGPFLHRPMGIAADSTGHLWIANSGLVDLPCPKVTLPQPTQGSVAALRPDGTPVSATAFQDAGVTIPWGIAVDGNDNVWVANFGSKRVSQVCGIPAIDCRPGTGVGAAISPDITGYAFDGLTRNTGVAIDPSGNVWLANNFKEIPNIPGNPGGYEIVAFIGLAGPVQPPAPRVRPQPSFTG